MANENKSLRYCLGSVANNTNVSIIENKNQITDDLKIIFISIATRLTIYNILNRLRY